MLEKTYLNHLSESRKGIFLAVSKRKVEIMIRRENLK